MKKAVVFLADGFEEIEAVSVIDVLRRAGIEVLTVSVTGRREVKGSHDICLNADSLFDDTDFGQVDMLLLPGGMPGAMNLNNHSGLRRKILEFNEKGKAIGAICAAPLVFGNLGILKNRNATCYPGFEKYLQDAKLQSGPVVTDVNIVTGSGPGVALQFALAVVEILTGREKAETLARNMLVPGY
jgi:protein deglycase